MLHAAGEKCEKCQVILKQESTELVGLFSLTLLAPHCRLRYQTNIFHLLPLYLCLFSSLESSWNQSDEQESYRYSHILAANSCEIQERPGRPVPSVIPPQHRDQNPSAGAPRHFRWVSPWRPEAWQCVLGSDHCCNEDWLGRGVSVDLTPHSQSYKCER